jgi:ABC-type histidine transport system ATPase subunit
MEAIANGVQQSQRRTFLMLCSLGTGLIATLLRCVQFLASTAAAEIFFEKKKFCVSLKRIAVFIGSAQLIVLLILWNHLGFVLDDILFPSWRHQSVHRPLFM